MYTTSAYLGISLIFSLGMAAVFILLEYLFSNFNWYRPSKGEEDKAYSGVFVREESRIEFRNRIISSLHAIVTFVGACIVMSDSALRNNPSTAASPLAAIICSYSLAYMCFDFCCMLAYKKFLWTIPFALHHIFSVLGLGAILIYEKGYVYAMSMFLTEATTTFVNFKHLFDEWKNPPTIPKAINSACIALLWWPVRVGAGLYTLYMYGYADYENSSKLPLFMVISFWCNVLFLNVFNIIFGCVVLKAVVQLVLPVGSSTPGKDEKDKKPLLADLEDPEDP